MSLKTTFFLIKNRRFDMPYSYVSYFECESIECSICLDKLDKKNTVSLDNCNHMYHDKCIREWLKKSRLCPLCRSNVDISEISSECKCLIF